MNETTIFNYSLIALFIASIMVVIGLMWKPETYGKLIKQNGKLHISKRILIVFAFILILFNGVASKANELHEHSVKQVVVQFVSGSNQTEIDDLIERY